MRDGVQKSPIARSHMRQKADILFVSGAAPININLLVRNHIFSIQIAIVSK
jgi:hypothetical protein